MARPSSKPDTSKQMQTTANNHIKPTAIQAASKKHTVKTKI